jgi:hypothetical protein
MQLFLTLLLAHLFADFPLQTNALARFKSNHLAGVLLHAVIYTIVTALLVSQWQAYWPLVVGLGLIHFAIDATKPLIGTKIDEVRAFLVDQCLHLATMIGATYCAYHWWDPTPMGIVPYRWLPAALAAAFLPALMVGYWVWATSSGCAYVRRNAWLHHFYSRALVIEQRFGLVVLGVIFWMFVRAN